MDCRWGVTRRLGGNLSGVVGVTKAVYKSGERGKTLEAEKLGDFPKSESLRWFEKEEKGKQKNPGGKNKRVFSNKERTGNP